MVRPDGDGAVLADGRDGSVLAEARRLFAAFRRRDCVERLTSADAERPLDADEPGPQADRRAHRRPHPVPPVRGAALPLPADDQLGSPNRVLAHR